MVVEIRTPSANVENLTQTNDILSATDRVAYTHEFLTVKNRLVHVRREISEATERIRTLQEEELHLVCYSETYKRILHPIRQLSDQILREIFLACLEQHDILTPIRKHDLPSDSLDPTKAPWTLGQVCRRWRRVALSSPSLWTFIRVRISEPLLSSTSIQKTSRMANQLASRLRRSGNLPLTLDIAIPSSGIFSPNPNHPLLFALYSHSSRWAAVRLEITMNNVDVFTCMSSMVKAETPILHTIVLDLKGQLSEDGVIDAFEFAPCLQHVTLCYRLKRDGVKKEKGAEDDDDMGLRIVLKMPWTQIKQFRRLALEDNQTTITCGPLP
ncbi:hypothetical protein VNI00_004798 [Paramarasmius palmivorus]|uniref:F-box domain-containing protein n=1 Tax=Paramarasmius palmivorus TaxID=297713 RepID=A0AAW0DHG8_9AGAR